MPSCANFISLRPKQVKLLPMDQHPETDRILALILEGLILQPLYYSEGSEIWRTDRVLASPFHTTDGSPPHTIPSHYPATHKCGRRLFGRRARLVGNGTSYRPIRTQIRSLI